MSNLEDIFPILVPKTSDGILMPIMVPKNATVSEIRKWIAKGIGIPTSCVHRIFLSAETLIDERPVSSYPIFPGTVLGYTLKVNTNSILPSLDGCSFAVYSGTKDELNAKYGLLIQQGLIVLVNLSTLTLVVFINTRIANNISTTISGKLQHSHVRSHDELVAATVLSCLHGIMPKDDVRISSKEKAIAHSKKVKDTVLATLREQQKNQ
jgi:hypothetical protein